MHIIAIMLIIIIVYPAFGSLLAVAVVVSAGLLVVLCVSSLAPDVPLGVFGCGCGSGSWLFIVISIGKSVVYNSFSSSSDNRKYVKLTVAF